MFKVNHDLDRNDIDRLVHHQRRLVRDVGIDWDGGVGHSAYPKGIGKQFQ